MNRANCDVLIVGGGLHGLSAALWLARAGASVIVLEKDAIGTHASGVNAGGVRRLGRALAEVPLAQAAHDMWMDIAALVDDDCGFRSTAQVRVAETDHALGALRERAGLVAAAGYSHEQILDQQALRELLPAVAGHCVGGLAVRGDGYADPARTVQAFARAAQARGAMIDEGIAVNGVQYDDGQWCAQTSGGTISAQWLVNAAGAWAGAIAQQLDEPVPMRAAALMMSQTQPVAPFVDVVVGCQGRALSLKQLPDGSVLIGGAMEGKANLQSGTCELDENKLTANMQTAADVLPAMRDATVARAWAGIEAMLPDNIPVIGPSLRYPNAIHAFGFCGHGFQLAPVVGQIVAQIVASGQAALPIGDFSIGRFTTPQVATP